MLRGVKYGETSQIVTLFTRRMGTVAVMARGARGAKSRFGSSLQPLSHVQVVFYFKPARDVHTLSESSHISLFSRTSRDLERMATAVRIVETVASLYPRPEPDERMFDILLEILTRLNQAEDRWKNLLPFFQLQISASLGFSPMVDREDVRSVDSAGGYFSLIDGSISRRKPSSPSVSATRSTLRAVGILVHADLDTIMQMNLDKPVLDEVIDLVESYLRYHVEDFRPSRSKTVYDRIL